MFYLFCAMVMIFLRSVCYLPDLELQLHIIISVKSVFLCLDLAMYVLMFCLRVSAP